MRGECFLNEQQKWGAQRSAQQEDGATMKAKAEQASLVDMYLSACSAQQKSIYFSQYGLGQHYGDEAVSHIATDIGSRDFDD
jgi:hypothetical protein